MVQHRHRLRTALALGAGLALALPASASATNLRVSVFAGNGTNAAPIAGPALSSPMGLQPSSVVFGADGSVSVEDFNYIDTIDQAGNLTKLGSGGSSNPFVPGPAATAPLGYGYGFGPGLDGSMFYMSNDAYQVLKIRDGQASAIVDSGASGTPTPGPAMSSPVSPYGGVGQAADGTVYFMGTSDHLYKVTPDGTLSQVALSTAVSYVPELDFDAAGNLYLNDENLKQVFKVTPSGTMTVVAGDGTNNAPVAGPAVSSPLGNNVGMEVTPAGDIYLTDASHNYVEHVDTTGTLSIIAGNGGSGALVPGNPLSTPIAGPSTIGVSPAGTIYVATGGSWSGTRLVRIGDDTASAPRDVQLARGTSSGATVSFLAPYDRGTSAIAGYDVSLDGGATWIPITPTTGSDGRLSAPLSDVPSDRSSSVLVRARNASGAGVTSPRADLAAVPATAAAPAATAPVATPAATPAAVPVARRVCTLTRRVSLHWKVRGGVRLKAVKVTINGRTAKQLPGAARAVKVKLPGATAHRWTVTITGTTTSGQKLSNTRHYRVCATRKAGTARRPVNTVLLKARR